MVKTVDCFWQIEAEEVQGGFVGQQTDGYNLLESALYHLHQLREKRSLAYIMQSY